MGLFEATALGIISLSMVLLSLTLNGYKRYLGGLLSAFAALICLPPCAYFWRLALIDSGKNPAWLGYRQYPVVPIVLAVMACLAVICITADLARLGQRAKRRQQ